MKLYKSDIASCSNSSACRMGVVFEKKYHALFLSRYCANCTLRLKDICLIEKGTSITEEQAQGDGMIPVVAGGKTPAYFHDEYNREGNIICISASGSAGFVSFWNEPIWASDCITVRSKDEGKYCTKFLYYLLKIVQDDIYLLQIGTDQPHVYVDDIGLVMIPDIPIAAQQRLLDKLKPFEEQIEELSKEIKPEQKIIDEVFGKECGFNYIDFDNEKTKTLNSTSLSSVSMNDDLRFSTKFFRKAGAFVKKELTKNSTKKVKDFLAEPIVLGATISQNDYSDDGEFYYVSMATISNWEFDSDKANLVSKQFSNLNAIKAVKKGDIIMVRSGEGSVGKVALIKDEDIKGIFCDFTMRIRAKDIEPEFMFYYFRTSYFQYLVQIYKKGLGGNTNIYPKDIQEFPMPDLSAEIQSRIVNEIGQKIKDQSIPKEKIADKENQIDIIIEQGLKSEAIN